MKATISRVFWLNFVFIELREIQGDGEREQRLLGRKMDSPAQVPASVEVLFDFFYHENVVDFRHNVFDFQAIGIIVF